MSSLPPPKDWTEAKARILAFLWRVFTSRTNLVLMPIAFGGFIQTVKAALTDGTPWTRSDTITAGASFLAGLGIFFRTIATQQLSEGGGLVPKSGGDSPLAASSVRDATKREGNG